MPTTDEVIGDVLTGIEAVRPGIAILEQYYDPPTLKAIALGMTLLYEGLVHLRAALDKDGTEAIRVALAAKSDDAIQQLMALKFGAK